MRHSRMQDVDLEFVETLEKRLGRRSRKVVRIDEKNVCDEFERSQKILVL